MNLAYHLDDFLAVSGAFTSGNEKESQLLMEYVKLVIVSPCTEWHFRSQMFIVCPNLPSELILGLDFLKWNSLVIDPDGETIIDKNSGFNLLHHLI